tara:strand:+ start:369 stop:737 length:369 start_codon:yes stop_codon:yes gene_type:complete
MNSNNDELLTEEELEEEYNNLKKINDETEKIVKKRYEASLFYKTPINVVLTNVANKTIDVFKELSNIVIKPRQFKYQEKFKWWRKYQIYFNEIMDVLKQDDRMIYFGLFLVLLAFLLNFFTL